MTSFLSLCRTVISSLIEKSYPSLRGKRIIAHALTLGHYSACVLWLPWTRIIFVNPLIAKKGRRYLRGLFAHELAHFDLVQPYGWFGYWFFLAAYWGFPSVRKRNEHRADFVAIKKGYARDLHYAISHRLSKGTSSERFYLTARELKAHAQSVGKW